MFFSILGHHNHQYMIFHAFENEWFSCIYNWKHFKLKIPTQHYLLESLYHLNKQMNHFAITQESLKCKFINSSTLSMKPNYISMWKTHMILFQSHKGERFYGYEPIPWLLMAWIYLYILVQLLFTPFFHAIVLDIWFEPLLIRAQASFNYSSSKVEEGPNWLLEDLHFYHWG